jgi:hypothetical protein
LEFLLCQLLSQAAFFLPRSGGLIIVWGSSMMIDAIILFLLRLTKQVSGNNSHCKYAVDPT